MSAKTGRNPAGCGYCQGRRIKVNYKLAKLFTKSFPDAIQSICIVLITLAIRKYGQAHRLYCGTIRFPKGVFEWTRNGCRNDLSASFRVDNLAWAGYHSSVLSCYRLITIDS